MSDLSRIYSAVYSGVPVFEMVVNDVAVMRRRTDSYMNATQILKVANIEKGKRTKILEKEVLISEHEKVQGGYGKYQGTWIPFEKSKELAARYGVLKELGPLFNFQLDSMGTEDGEDSSLLTKEQAIAAKKKLNPEQQLPKPPKQKSLPKPQPSSSSHSEEQQPRKKTKTTADMDPMENSLNIDERDRSVLMSIFLSDSPDQIPDLLKNGQEQAGLNIDMVIDEQGHTALHWATALARTKTVELLVSRGANIACTSYTGETPLMRGTMVTNSFENNTFDKTVDLLRESIPIIDNKRRNALHHAALTAGIRGRMNAAVYYMKLLIENLIGNDEEKYAVLNAQDSLGDTPLTIAARLKCQPLVDLLTQVGATQSAENNSGLQAGDYSEKDVVSSEDQARTQRVFSNSSLYSKKPYAPSQRGKEIIATVQKIVDALDAEYGGQLTLKEQELQKVQDDLNNITSELESTRKGLEERQTQSQKLSEAQQKTKNIQNAIQAGWIHLEEIMKRAGKPIPDYNAIDNCEENEDIDALFAVPELKIPENSTEEEKKTLLDNHIKLVQAKVKAYTANDLELKRETTQLEDQFFEKEMQCKRLIAACCNLPIDKIDDLVEPLTLAIESDPPDLDLARVIGFMDKIRRQGAFAEPVSSSSPLSVSADASLNNTRGFAQDSPFMEIDSPIASRETDITTSGHASSHLRTTDESNTTEQPHSALQHTSNQFNNQEFIGVKTEPTEQKVKSDEDVEMTAA